MRLRKRTLSRSTSAASMPAAGWCVAVGSSSSGALERRVVVGVGAGAGGRRARAASAAGEVESLAHLARRLHAQPQARHRLVHVGDQRAGDAHREVEARLVELAVVRVVVVVEQVDAAAERDLRVDDAELAVQAPPALRQQHAPAARRIEDAPVHAGRLPARLPGGRDVAGADAVDDDADLDAARRRALERLGDLRAARR